MRPTEPSAPAGEGTRRARTPLARFRRILAWTVFLVLTIVVGAVVFAYHYATDSATLAELIRTQAPHYLPGCRVDVKRVSVHPFTGEISINAVVVDQVDADGVPNLAARFQWIHLSFDPREMFDGKFVPRRVVITYPTIRLRRKEDGTWNIQDLLANRPKMNLGSTPPIRIENGTVELVDDDSPETKPVAVLRDVSVDLGASDGPAGKVEFTGSARGQLFEFLHLNGMLEKSTGRISLQGDIGHVSVAGLLRSPLPPEIRPALDAVNLTSGEADLSIESLVYDPASTPKIRNESTIRLRAGVWSPVWLPYTLNDLSALISVEDGRATIERAEGYNGPTTVRANGWADVVGETRGAFDLTLEVVALELDDRLKVWTPEKFKKLWDEYKPSGRVDVAWHGARAGENSPIDWGLGVGLRDVAMEYHLFRYPLEHVTGELTCKPKWIELDLAAQAGGKPLKAKGRIDDPGPNPIIKIDFEAGALPVDGRLKDAMPPDVRKVVESFSPAGTVKGKATLTRTKTAPGEDPKKSVRIDAGLDLNPDCEMTWDGLKYKVTNLTGHLEIHPDLWIFRDVRGRHGQSQIRGAGRVARLGPTAFDVKLDLKADNLLFDEQLRDALPPAWQKTWATLNPTGASDVEADITVKPGTRDRYKLTIRPRPETNLRLSFERTPDPGEVDPPPPLELRLEDVAGLIVFDNGKVKLTDGGFFFRNSPVTFSEGEVQVFDSGQFTLNVRELYVKDFKFDAGLRKLMPPVMAQFARRLDDGKAFTMRANLGLAWSGRHDETTTCSWSQGRVILNGNSVEAGVPIRFIQGEIQNLNGWFNGKDLEVRGALDLASVNLFDQQVREVTSPIEIVGGKAKLPDIAGKLLDGRITGDLEVSLDKTPSFSTRLSLEGARLERYAETMPGRQTFKGVVGGSIALAGRGSDPHTLQGSGKAQVKQGDLGKLPGIVRFLKGLSLAPTTPTAFDTAEVKFVVHNGTTSFNPISFTGDAFSLKGEGKLDPQGELDVRLNVVYGRDSWRIPVVSDAMRRASSQFILIKVDGTPASPDFKVVTLPAAGNLFKSLGERPTGRNDREKRR